MTPWEKLLSDAQGFGRGVRDNTVPNILGGPVDLINLGTSAVGLGSQNPVGGSNWIRQRLERAGVTPPSQGNPLEAFGGMVGGMFAPGAAATAGRAAFRAEQNAAAPMAARSGPLGAQLGAINPQPYTPGQQTVSNPQRNAFPGVYKSPEDLVSEARAMTAPESPLLKQLFGVTRDDLYQMSLRKGNEPGFLPGAAAKPKGSAAAEAVMTPQNEGRILSVLERAKTGAPELYKGMHAWYTMDPQYDAMVRLMGKDAGTAAYNRLNTFGGIESPNMPVDKEFIRATSANMLNTQGRWSDWVNFGGLKGPEKAAAGAPADMLGMPGRVGHIRAATSQDKYLRTGNHGMDSPKAPPYIQASGTPSTGFQTDLPVGDAHWARSVGLADTRTSAGFDASVSTPEIQQLAPWWREMMGQVGLEAVPGQAINWGVYAPQTGVKTKIGAPKLELHAIQIGEAAKRMGISPQQALEMVLTGQARAGK